MGGGSSIIHPFLNEINDPNLGEEAYQRSLNPATWENLGLSLYKERFGNALYNETDSSQFPPAPERTFIERHYLCSHIRRIRSLMSFAALVRGMRPTHNIGIGGLGEGTVLDNPDIPKNAFFSPGRKFPLRIRHSNALGTFCHDGGFEPRGFSIKFADSVSAAPLDLILNTGEDMGFFNLNTFSEFTSAQLSKDDAKQMAYISKYPSAVVSAIGSYRRQPKSYNDLHYYSQICFVFHAEDGKPRICRFRAVPYGDGPQTTVAPEQSGLPDLQDQRNVTRKHGAKFGAPRDPNKPSTYLHTEYMQRVENNQARYRLQIQFKDAPKESSHEIYNPNKMWNRTECPFHDLMTINIASVLDPNETEKMHYNVEKLPGDTLGIVPAYSETDYNSIAVCRAQVYSWSQRLRSWTVTTIPSPPGTKRVNYLITTLTSTVMGSGTMSPMCIAIHGSTGSTTSMDINTNLHLHQGATDVFQYMAEDVGAPIAIRAEKQRNDKDRWRVHLIRVQYTQDEIHFLCSRWVEYGSKYFLRRDLGVLKASTHPEYNPMEAQIRKQMLLTNQQDWVWNDDPAGVLPRHGSIADMNNLPLDHQFSVDRFVSFGLSEMEGQFNAYLATKIQNMHAMWRQIGFEEAADNSGSPADVEFAYTPDRIVPSNRIPNINAFSNSGLFVPGIMKVPERASRWRSDVEFADRMLSGASPTCIVGINEIPPSMNVTAAMVQHLMPEKGSLQSQLAAGLVYYIDHGPALEGIEQWTPAIAKTVDDRTEHKFSMDSSQRYAPPVQGLFHVHPNVNGTARLMPIAIQLLRGPDAAVFVPKNPEMAAIDLDWIVAKTYFMVSHAQVHQMITHLFCTHLIMEPFVVAMERQLPPVHPVNKLLHHHILGTVAINTFGRQILIADGGLADRCMSIGGGGHIQMMVNYYKNGDRGQGIDFFQRFNHEKFCAYRNVHRVDQLPRYPYRDDGMTMWNAIKKYVTEFLAVHYKDDASIKADIELQNWVHDLRANAFVATRMKSFPGSFETVQDVIEMITILIFQLSCGHAAVNFTQWDEFAFIPTTPTAALRPPPTAPGQFTMNDFMDIFPSIPMIRQQIITANTLCDYNDIEQFLVAPYSDDIFADNEQVVVARFKDDLQRIDNEMFIRNKDAEEKGIQVSGDAYRYLMPRWVPNSIAI